MGPDPDELDRHVEKLDRLVTKLNLLVTVDEARIGWELSQGNLEPARAQAQHRDAHIRALLEDE
jgi:hypothetical protein